MAKIAAIALAVAICIGIVGYALYWDTTEAPRLKDQAKEYVKRQENMLANEMSRNLQGKYRILARYNQVYPGVVTQIVKDNVVWSYTVSDIYEVRAQALIDFVIEDPEAVDYRVIIAVFPYDIRVLSKGIDYDLNTDEIVLRSNLP